MKFMLGISQIDIWFYGGIAVMVLAVVLGIICGIVYSVTGRKLRKKLEKEYGKPQRNSGSL